MDINQLKKAAADEAAKFVEDGMMLRAWYWLHCFLLS
jgi:hypothetical protein